jgi:hypothetical protein
MNIDILFFPTVDEGIATKCLSSQLQLLNWKKNSYTTQNKYNIEKIAYSVLKDIL